MRFRCGSGPPLITGLPSLHSIPQLACADMRSALGCMEHPALPLIDAGSCPKQHITKRSQPRSGALLPQPATCVAVDPSEPYTARLVTFGVGWLTRCNT
jgi:hypothetical protein